jgi:hypothetical protein
MNEVETIWTGSFVIDGDHDFSCSCVANELVDSPKIYPPTWDAVEFGEVIESEFDLDTLKIFDEDSKEYVKNPSEDLIELAIDSLRPPEF